ncbi:hypothetical protein DL764_000720 [Monosporascus ibericus]|uniref:Cytochrome P450 n=1 Tax=Monosporascus ibericus TaxID=155417 RepID=A0A4Q4TSG9_9PEZI|nr:hypothetical protein DL764_000720 [Monosporascus ibericus]
MERIVLSPRYLPELSSVPEEVLSLREGMVQVSSLIPQIHEETEFWLARAIPDGSISTVAVGAYETILRTIAGVTSRVFVGLPRCRDEKWLDTAVNYTMDVFRLSSELRPYPPFLRRFVAPWLASTKRLQEHVRVASDCFGSIFAQRLAEPDGEGKRANDMFQWMADSAKGADRSTDVLIRKMLFLTLAAIHTSTMSTTHALFDLCAHPEYMEPLRREIGETVEANGWSLAAINELKLLDSFVKESQRLNHPGLPGTFISMPTNAIARDPDNYPDPEQFDAFRFYKQRQSSESEVNRHQFVSTGRKNLAFGHGKFACPGRFYAAAQIKMVIAYILVKYDVSFPGQQTVRPANNFFGESISPDRRQTVVFKSRRE